jgi:hypothetical protein
MMVASLDCDSANARDRVVAAVVKTEPLYTGINMRAAAKIGKVTAIDTKSVRSAEGSTSRSPTP